MSRLLILLLAAFALIARAAAAVEVVSTGEGRWELRADGRPYEIRGVTFSGTGGPAAYDRDCEKLAAIGVNTIRTWGAGNDTPALLDAAHKHGLRVLLGLWFRHGQPGAEADDSFDYTRDTAGIASQQAAILKSVRAYKDHPALLAWGVGNEVFLNLPNDEAKTAYALALEAACREIKLIDPHHPLIAVDAFTKGVSWVERFCPSVDAHGINIYGAGIAALPAALAKAGSTRPWLVTEYGSRGDWDTPKDKNGVKLESSDDEKYRVITDAWNKTITPQRIAGRCLGLFVFNYSNSLSYTNLKHGLLLGESTRPAWHAVREIYLGEKPSAPLTSVTRFRVISRDDAPAGWMAVEVTLAEATTKFPAITFACNFRSAATRSKRDAIISLESRPGPSPDIWFIRPPDIKGPAKIYALLTDASHVVVTATTSTIFP
ncbi:hypothetical protein [Rariglobus hedericola]|uniref:Glycoside hydrolase family 2 catalytic domain-containing protein n=1 Tax=Rariglobus hedericola TaxID=2597822 RepID=A0A556QS47_9BACT|nr:hypothetical protein [Rariglobus hedericola]TSJ79461.1 hypothetical protein FPL22_09290 [Rariglobus hedericola]